MAKEALLKLHTEIVHKQSTETSNDSSSQCEASESLILRSLIRCALESKGSFASQDVPENRTKTSHEEVAKYCQLAAERLEDLGYANFCKEKEVRLDNSEGEFE